MIAHLQGTIAWKKPPRLLLAVNGVGYELEAPMTVFYELPEVGGEAALHTHFVARDDARLLYGFHSMEQRDMFRLLLRVNGVGPRIALAILSGMTPADFRACVDASDSASLSRIPGIGAKTARRLLMEMRDRLPDEEEGAAPAAPDAVQDAIRALVALGYKHNEAARAVRAAADAADAVLRAEELIRAALRAVSGGAR